MTGIVVGVLAVLVGALLCFRGYATARVVLALWGAVVGFWLGASVVAATAAEPLLGSVTGWVVALVGAVLAAALAYAYYVLSVLLSLGGAVYVVVAALVGSAGTSEAVVLTVSLVAAVLVAVVALLTGLPRLLLVLLTAAGGATLLTTGVMRLLGSPALDGATGAPVGPWWLLVLGLLVAGVVVQLRSQRPRTPVREDWSRQRAVGT